MVNDIPELSLPPVTWEGSILAWRGSLKVGAKIRWFFSKDFIKIHDFCQRIPKCHAFCRNFHGDTISYRGIRTPGPGRRGWGWVVEKPSKSPDFSELGFQIVSRVVSEQSNVSGALPWIQIDSHSTLVCFLPPKAPHAFWTTHTLCFVLVSAECRGGATI